MGKTVGPVFEDAKIASAVSFTYYPLPDDTMMANETGGMSGCSYADQVEACVVSATGCVDGCSGDSLTKLTSFISCYEKKFVEMICTEAKTNVEGCLGDSGVDLEKYNTCFSSPSTISSLQKKFADAGKNVMSFPKVTIAGKVRSNDAQDQKDLKKALCTAGVQAAC